MVESTKASTSRIVEELDRKFASVFKALLKASPEVATGDKQAKEFRALRVRVVDDELGKTLDGLFQDFARPATQRRTLDVGEASELVRAMRDRGFVATSSQLFISWREVFASLTLEMVVPTAPDAGCLEEWMKTTKVPVQ